MIKLMYLARRKPGFSPDDFTRRWRMHGAKGMSVSMWRHAIGYSQAEPIRPVPIAGASDEYDAIACYIVKDEAFSDFLPEDAEGNAMLEQDELETFAGSIMPVAQFVNEEVLKPGVRYCQSNGWVVTNLIAVTDEQGPFPVSLFSLLARGHPARGHAVREVPSLAAQCRGSAARTRHRAVP